MMSCSRLKEAFLVTGHQEDFRQTGIESSYGGPDGGKGDIISR